MRTNLISFFCLILFISVDAQQKITVEAIYRGEFSAQRMDELQSMKNTNRYTVLNSDQNSGSAQIDLYDFATLIKVSTLIDTKNQPLLSGGIDSYTKHKYKIVQLE